MDKSQYEKYLGDRWHINISKNEGVRIVDGQLVLKNGDKKVPIVNSIPRFVERENYADNFGLQWNKFRSTQLDSYMGKPVTADRFWKNTKWAPAEIKGKAMLEAGSGAGRFTEIMLGAGAKLASFDYSNAVEANFKNNAHKGDLFLFQGDLFDIPFDDKQFDFVFCYGVLQHTPDPEKAFYAIEKKLKPGGKISIDVYHKDGKIRPWKSKYIWRPITTKIDPQKLLKFLKYFIPVWLPFDTAIKLIPVLRNYLGAVIPCWNYFYMDLSLKEKVEWAVMDTFDVLAAKYDIPMTMADVDRWFKNCGYTNYEVFEGSNGIVGNGIKP
ncbi:class I SAM-dependent methyltransferase [Candidatus Peregrinibacteria bacterium]|nr:class I SAM-dependent methyltransferase [Candidatus Peregrinibacteria bacterium]